MSTEEALIREFVEYRLDGHLQPKYLPSNPPDNTSTENAGSHDVGTFEEKGLELGHVSLVILDVGFHPWSRIGS